MVTTTVSITAGSELAQAGDVVTAKDAIDYSLSIDLYHMSSEVEAQPGPFIQWVMFDPRDRDGDPLVHVRQWPDGSAEIILDRHANVKITYEG